MNNITLNWSAEDRARIDKLIGLLEGLTVAAEAKGLIETKVVEEDLYVPETAKMPYTPENPAELPPEVLEAMDEAQTPQAAEIAPDEPPAVENVPTYTVEDVRAKAKDLTRAGKRVEAKAIVNEYAANITDLPADKCDEVMERLTALEG